MTMADDGEELTTNPTLGKGRMEAFSDGVLAIAITLLVLDVAIRPPGSPTDEFLRGWPTYLAYLISFLTVGAAWLAHHGLTDRLDRVDPIFLRLNLLFLLAVSFLPFPTRLVAEALDKTTTWERLGVFVYGITLLVIRVLFAIMTGYSRRERLRRPGPDDPDLAEARRKFRFVFVAYLVTIVLGLFVPVAAIVLYFGIAVVMVVPFRTVAREIRARPPE
jgi:uncharacterized membrane protein